MITEIRLKLNDVKQMFSILLYNILRLIRKILPLQISSLLYITICSNNHSTVNNFKSR